MDLTAPLQRFDSFFTQQGCGDFPHDDVLLTQTLTHKSFAADAPSQQIPFNERLEFLGDAILATVIADQLFADYPDLPESLLTLKKIHLIKEQTLAKVSRQIGAGAWIRLGKGEERSGGREKDVVLADLFESLIAYVWLRGGRPFVSRFVLTLVYPYREEIDMYEGKSYKSLLQEWMQKHYQALPVYRDTEGEKELSGNVLSYRSEVIFEDQIIGTGAASNKRKAQEEAAKMAYERLELRTKS